MKLLRTVRRLPLAIQLVLLTVVLTVTFLGLSYCVNLIDDEAVRENALESERQLKEESWNSLPTSLFLRDRYTDVLIVGIPAVSDSLGVFHKILINPDASPSGNGYCWDKYIRYLSDPVNGAPDEFFIYGRYWHGYQLTIKPLLVFFSYYGIRMINYIVLYSLFVWTLWLICKKLDWKTAMLLLITFFMVGFTLVPDTLQYSTCFYICLIAAIILLKIPRRRLTDRLCIPLFYILGAVTVFFDFLTTPILTLGIPLTLLLLYRKTPARLPSTLKLIASWFGGYFILWSIKWILVSLFTEYNMIADAYEASLLRLDGGTPWGAVTATSYEMVALLFLLFIVEGYTFHYFLLGKGKGQRNEMLSFMLISTLPFLWFFGLHNHSYVHWWFVWRIFAVAIFNLLIIWTNHAQADK